MDKKPKKKLEFMQKMLVFLFAASVLFTTASYLLAAFDRNNTCENLSIAIVQTLWVADGAGVLGYAWQNCMRAKWFGDKTARSENNDNDGV